MPKSRFYIGTAGWSYEDWVGIVYPEKKEAGFHPLAFLAAYINIVEVNSTFYRPPAAGMSWFWLRRVADRPDFLFSIKVHQVFTHEREGWTQKDVDGFKLGIEPLRAGGRLASLLFQFPWSFYHSDANADYLAKLFQVFSGYPLTVEVRHSSWESEDFFDLLTAHHVCYCNIDQPVIRNSIKPSARATLPDFSYVRLHGRNYRDWFREGAGRDDRYNYLYSKDELEEWIGRIKQLGKTTEKVFIITNNHYRGQALANALQIKNMISGEQLDIPRALLKTYPILEEIVKKIARGQLDLFDEKQ
ncbi:MAG: DUF72 domain-containing protein [Acidobacteriota bacterium]